MAASRVGCKVGAGSYQDEGPLYDMPFDMDDPELRRAPAAFRTAVSIASDNWDAGSLTFVLPSGRELLIEGARPGPRGVRIVRDFRFVGRVLASADIGFGEGFMAGEWDTPDLSALLEAFTLNFDRLRAAGRWQSVHADGEFPHPYLQQEQQGRLAAQHPRPLRPRQRLLFAVARRQHDLFLRPL